jgi:hypothetical protein
VDPEQWFDAWCSWMIERERNKTVMAYFKILYQHLPGSHEENYENLSHDSWLMPKIESKTS